MRKSVIEGYSSDSTDTRDRPMVDWPVWWFVRLEMAVERGDHAAAAEAQRELKRLGVYVNYGQPKAKPWSKG